MNFSALLQPGCALFLDFDGTLVDIAPRPEAVVVPRELIATLQAMQAFLDGAVAVISGRPIEQIDALLAPARLPAAGVHGAERRSANGYLVLADVPSCARVHAAAQTLARQHPGLRVELKRGSVALHYRQAPTLEAVCMAAMQTAGDASPGLTLLRGKMVLEAKPSGVSKGHAIEAFMAEPPFKGRTPVFIGDDVTDEAGFDAVQRRGGVAVKVGEGATVATHRMADPAQMREQLRSVIAGRMQQGTNTESRS
jgi:trehalose 6-phosphate phosphatase